MKNAEIVWIFESRTGGIRGYILLQFPLMSNNLKK